MIKPIPIKLPESFEAALGYKGVHQWVALFWEPGGDEARYNDGYCDSELNWWAFQKFLQHPNVRPWLAGYDFGSSEEEATHHLLCDLIDRTLAVGTKAEVETFIIGQIRINEPPIRSNAKSLEPEQMKELLDKFAEEMRNMPVPTTEEMLAVMEQERAAVNNMIKDLDKGVLYG